MRNIYKLAALAVLCSMLVACGQGGGENTHEIDGVSQEEMSQKDANEDNANIEAVQENKEPKTITVEYTDTTTSYVVDTYLENEEYVIEQLPWPCFWGGAAYSIRTNDGKLILIDGGFMEEDGEKIKQYVESHGGVVDDWIITHPHVDHVGAFIYNTNTENPINIKNVYYAPFTQEYFEDEDSEVAAFLQNATLFTEFNQALENNQIPSKALVKGDVLTYGEMTLECISSFRAEVKDVNSNSLVMKCSIADFTMLFTGDMTEETITYIQKDFPEGMDVDFLQIPHHGYMAGIHGATLYEYTKPEYALLDCTVEEYNNNSVNIKDHVQLIEDFKIEVIKRFEGNNEIKIQ